MFQEKKPTKNSLYYSQGISQKCTSPPTKPVPSGRVVTSWTLSILSCLPVGMWKEGWFKTWYKNNSDAKMFLLHVFYKLGFSALSWRHSCWEHHAVFLYPLWWWKPNKGTKDTETWMFQPYVTLRLWITKISIYILLYRGHTNSNRPLCWTTSKLKGGNWLWEVMAAVTALVIRLSMEPTPLWMLSKIKS